MPRNLTDKLLASLESGLLKQSVIPTEVKFAKQIRNCLFFSVGDQALNALLALTDFARSVNI